MEEIYWIQRLGILNTVAIVVVVISSVLIVLSLLYYFLETEDYIPDEKKIAKSISALRSLFIAMIISGLCAIFIPTKTDLYAIYGIGGTIDYIRSNDTAKRLPDKVINALDKWIDDKTKEDER